MKKAFAAIAAAAVIITLAGCAPTYSKAEALATSGSVIELTNATFTEKSTFGYVNENSDTIELTNCEYPFLGKRSCTDSDGVHVFEWSVYKSNIRNASITTDGVKVELDCNTDTDDFWSGITVCVPKS